MSDLASMEPHYLNHRTSTILLIIHSSNWEISTCGRVGVCEGFTAVLSRKRCELSKKQVSLTQPELDDLGSAPLIGEKNEEKYTFWPKSYAMAIRHNKELRAGLERILLPSFCLGTTALSIEIMFDGHAW